jgi:hypothetical protein
MVEIGGIMRQHRLMVFGIAFLTLPFADCLLQEAHATASPDWEGDAVLRKLLKRLKSQGVEIAPEILQAYF